MRRDDALAVDRLPEILPARVALLDQLDLPGTMPFLHCLLARDSFVDGRIGLGENEAPQIIFSAKFGPRAAFMLGDARDDVGGDADIDMPPGLLVMM